MSWWRKSNIPKISIKSAKHANLTKFGFGAYRFSRKHLEKYRNGCISYSEMAEGDQQVNKIPRTSTKNDFQLREIQGLLSETDILILVRSMWLILWDWQDFIVPKMMPYYRILVRILCHNLIQSYPGSWDLQRDAVGKPAINTVISWGWPGYLAWRALVFEVQWIKNWWDESPGFCNFGGVVKWPEPWN